MSLSLVASAPEARDDGIELGLYDHSPDCIKVLHHDGRIKRLNPGGQIALELDHGNQLDGADWPSLWPGSEQARVEHAVAQGRDGKRTQFLAFCPTAKNSPRWWDVVVTPMQATPASPCELLVVSRDVTELVQAKEALVRLNAQKDAFLSTLSHELRNPLSALGMAANMIQTGYADVPQLSRMGDLIRRQVGHMSRLTEDLLDVSRITRGQVNLQLAPCDLRDVLQDVGEQLASMLAAKSQSLQQSLPDTPVLIHGDRMRLAQVLGNLIGNASRYSPADTSIDVAVVEEDGVARVTVADRGKGISAEAIGTLFDMYSQGQASTDRRTSGVGLGLAIVKGLVELHGGTVSGHSDGVGKGSVFTVFLPLS